MLLENVGYSRLDFCIELLVVDAKFRVEQQNGDELRSYLMFKDTFLLQINKKRALIQ